MDDNARETGTRHHLIQCGDSLELSKQIEPESIDLLVTSPPYWAKRTYHNGDDEIGMEPTPEAYVERLVSFFDAMRPYLKPTANIFINIGDTYFGSGAGAWKKYATEHNDGTDYDTHASHGDGNEGTGRKPKESFVPAQPLQPKIKQNGKLYRNKQLLLIPARFAIAMQEHGWLLRDDIIWHKPNRIPTPTRDRMKNTYEHVYHFTLNGRYFFNLDAVKIQGSNGNPKNPGDVWSINTQALKDSPHTATFPEELVERIIKCGSPENGVVFDPFLGTGTTWVVADALGRDCIGFELNREYFDFSKKRFNDERSGK